MVMQTAPTKQIETSVPSAKDLASAVLARLPDSATLIDIQYEMYVLAAIDEGQKDIDSGRVVSHEEVVRQFSEWRTR
jgi:predicted transcriptional regulator